MPVLPARGWGARATALGPAPGEHYNYFLLVLFKVPLLRLGIRKFRNSEIQHPPPDYLKCRSKMQKPNRDGWAKTKSSSVAYKGNDKKLCFNGQGFSGQ